MTPLEWFAWETHRSVIALLREWLGVANSIHLMAGQ